MEEPCGIVSHKQVDERLVLLEHPREELRLRHVLRDVVFFEDVVYDLARELEDPCSTSARGAASLLIQPLWPCLDFTFDRPTFWDLVQFETSGGAHFVLKVPVPF